jgi:hypothetical protein
MATTCTIGVYDHVSEVGQSSKMVLKWLQLYVSANEKWLAIRISENVLFIYDLHHILYGYAPPPDSKDSKGSSAAPTTPTASSTEPTSVPIGVYNPYALIPTIETVSWPTAFSNTTVPDGLLNICNNYNHWLIYTLPHAYGQVKIMHHRRIRMTPSSYSSQFFRSTNLMNECFSSIYTGIGGATSKKAGTRHVLFYAWNDVLTYNHRDWNAFAPRLSPLPIIPALFQSSTPPPSDSSSSSSSSTSTPIPWRHQQQRYIMLIQSNQVRIFDLHDIMRHNDNADLKSSPYHGASTAATYLPICELMIPSLALGTGHMQSIVSDMIWLNSHSIALVCNHPAASTAGPSVTTSALAPNATSSNYHIRVYDIAPYISDPLAQFNTPLPSTASTCPSPGHNKGIIKVEPLYIVPLGTAPLRSLFLLPLPHDWIIAMNHHTAHALIHYGGLPLEMIVMIMAYALD